MHQVLDLTNDRAAVELVRRIGQLEPAMSALRSRIAPIEKEIKLLKSGMHAIMNGYTQASCGEMYVSRKHVYRKPTEACDYWTLSIKKAPASIVEIIELLDNVA